MEFASTGYSSTRMHLQTFVKPRQKHLVSHRVAKLVYKFHHKYAPKPPIQMVKDSVPPIRHKPPLPKADNSVHILKANQAVQSDILVGVICEWYKRELGLLHTPSKQHALDYARKSLKQGSYSSIMHIIIDNAYKTHQFIECLGPSYNHIHPHTLQHSLQAKCRLTALNDKVKSSYVFDHMQILHYLLNNSSKQKIIELWPKYSLRQKYSSNNIVVKNNRWKMCSSRVYDLFYSRMKLDEMVGSHAQNIKLLTDPAKMKILQNEFTQNPDDIIPVLSGLSNCCHLCCGYLLVNDWLELLGNYMTKNVGNSLTPCVCEIIVSVCKDCMVAIHYTKISNIVMKLLSIYPLLNCELKKTIIMSLHQIILILVEKPEYVIL